MPHVIKLTIMHSSCLGGQVFVPSSLSKVSDVKCNIPCSGNPFQFCGGNISSGSKRQVDILLSVYQTKGNSATTVAVAIPAITISVPGPITALAGQAAYLTVGQPYVTVISSKSSLYLQMASTY
jgi:hypothetical protein